MISPAGLHVSPGRIVTYLVENSQSFFQLIVGAVGRIFQTALVNSQDSDDKEGESVGYLFGEIGSEKGTGNVIFVYKMTIHIIMDLVV